MEIILSRGKMLLQTDYTGRHFLCYAAEKCSADIVKCILYHADRLPVRPHPVYDDALRLAMNFNSRAVVNLLWPHRSGTSESIWCLFRTSLLDISQRSDIANRLIEETSFPDKIFMTELLGAAYVWEGNKHDALRLWARSLDLKPNRKTKNTYTDTDGREVDEFLSMRHLRALDKRQESMALQAYLVTRRIVVNTEAAPEFLIKALRSSDVIRSDIKEIARALNQIASKRILRWDSVFTGNSFLDAFRENLTSLNRGTQIFKFAMALPLLNIFIQAQNGLERKDCCQMHRPDLCPPHKRCPHCEFIEAYQMGFLRSVSLLLEFYDTASWHDKNIFRDMICLFIRDNPRIPHVPLFLALEMDEFNPGAIMELVECSAREAKHSQQKKLPLHLSTDHLGRTPLHLLAEYRDIKDTEIVECFVENGEHLCRRDRHGRRILDVLQNQGMDTSPFFPLPLRCLAARCTRQAAGDQCEGLPLPGSFIKFLHRH